MVKRASGIFFKEHLVVALDQQLRKVGLFEGLLRG